MDELILTPSSDTQKRARPNRAQKPKAVLPPPKKRAKSGPIFAVLLVILLGVIGFLAFGYYQQQQRLAEKERQLQALQTPPVTITPAPETPVEQAPLVKRNVIERSQFDSAISPDNRWLLSSDVVPAAANNERYQEIALEPLVGQQKKILASSNDLRGLPEADIWRPVGWSFDGKFVYVAVRSVNDTATENGGVHRQVPAGDRIFQVPVAEGQATAVLTIADHAEGEFLGIYDVHAEKSLALYAKKGTGRYELDLWLADVSGDVSKKLVTMTTTGGFPKIASAVLSPDAATVALMTYTQAGGTKYTLTFVDVRSGEQTVPEYMGKDAPLLFVRWKDAESVVLTNFSVEGHNEQLEVSRTAVAPEAQAPAAQ